MLLSVSCGESGASRSRASFSTLTLLRSIRGCSRVPASSTSMRAFSKFLRNCSVDSLTPSRFSSAGRTGIETSRSSVSSSPTEPEKRRSNDCGNLTRKSWYSTRPSRRRKSSLPDSTVYFSLAPRPPSSSSSASRPPGRILTLRKSSRPAPLPCRFSDAPSGARSFATFRKTLPSTSVTCRNIGLIRLSSDEPSSGVTFTPSSSLSSPSMSSVGSSGARSSAPARLILPSAAEMLVGRSVRRPPLGTGSASRRQA